MRRALIAGGAILLGAGALAFGAQDWLAGHAIALQREAQNALGAALRALRAGQPGAVTAFLGLCFTHGFLHALGPGHGKAVMAAYGTASGASLRRLMGIAALSSMAQALVAVLVVYSAVWLLDGARERVEGLARMIEPASAVLIALLGAMLCWRGLRGLMAMRRTRAHHHHHDHSGDCGCGHAHGPDVDRALAAHGWREAAALIAGIALRPCTSALFLLILTWRLGLDAIGIAGAFVMGVGTMAVTASAALAAWCLRRGVFLALPEGRALAPALAVVELAVGLTVTLVAGGLAIRLV